MGVPIRLLIAEDSDDDAILIVDRLRRAGLAVEYQRVETLDAAAVALITSPLPDVLICDYHLPGFSAGDVLQLLHGSGVDIPFILVSGQIGEEAAAALMRAGADDFMLKDRLTRLAPAVQRALGEAEVRRQRRVGEIALRESEERFRLLAEYAQDIIFRCRLVPHVSLEYLSPSSTEITGYEPAELYGDPALFFKTVAPEDQHLLEQSWREPSAGLLLTRWHRRNGDLAWMEQRAAGILGPDGTIIAVQGVLRDVTARVTAEHERTAMEAQLHQAQRLESLGQLAGGVAHDFNNLLAVILSYTALITEDVDAATVDDTGGRWAAIGLDLTRVRHAAERAAALTQQLLAFGRREIVQPCPLDLNASVSNVESLLGRTIGDHINVITDVAPDLWAVLADPGQVEQVLLNLAVNARDAIPISGGAVTISTRNVVVTAEMAVTLPGLKPGRHVQLQVSDTGSGMRPEVIAHAFEPFFTTKPKGSGTGLGLATVYGIVTQAAGHIRIESDSLHGTTFTILLPESELAPTAAGDGPFAPAIRPGGTVLVVENEEDLLEVTRRYLHRAGYEVITATSGADALDVAECHPGEIRLLITDVVMPNMLGKELALRLRMVRPAIRVLFMSGYAQPELASDGQLDPDVSLLEKPFSESGLLTKAAELLGTAT